MVLIYSKVHICNLSGLMFSPTTCTLCIRQDFLMVPTLMSARLWNFKEKKRFFPQIQHIQTILFEFCQWMIMEFSCNSFSVGMMHSGQNVSKIVLIMYFWITFVKLKRNFQHCLTTNKTLEIKALPLFQKLVLDASILPLWTELKVSKSRKQFLKFSILPKNERKKKIISWELLG